MPIERYRIPSNNTIFDAALTLYGDVLLATKIMTDNSFIEDINYDVSGKEVLYDSDYKATVLEPLLTESPMNKNVAQTYKPYNGQTIFDIALQLDGDFETIISMIQNSSLVNINDSIESDSVFTYTEKSTALLKWVRKTGYIFNTKDLNEIQVGILLQENGYYILQENGFALLY